MGRKMPTNKFAKELTRYYGMEIKPNEVHYAFRKLGFQPIEGNSYTLWDWNDWFRWHDEHSEDDFTNIIKDYRDRVRYNEEEREMERIHPKRTWADEPPIDYTPQESNMDYVNNELLNKYQTENMKKNFDKLVNENVKKVLKEYFGGQQDIALEILETLDQLIEKCQIAELYDEAEDLNDILQKIRRKLG